MKKILGGERKRKFDNDKNNLPSMFFATTNMERKLIIR